MKRRCWENKPMPRKPKVESSPEKVACTGCGEEKKLDEFFLDRRRAIGVTTACRECMKDENSYSKYKNQAKKEGIQSLYDLRSKHERTLKNLDRVITELEPNPN